MMDSPQATNPQPQPTDRDIVDALLDAYRNAVFPLGDTNTGEVHLFRPPTRGIIPLHESTNSAPHAFHVPARLERLIRTERFQLRADTAFEHVIRACAQPRKPSTEDRTGEAEPGTWINDAIIDWYTTLHRYGHAHSIEAWVTASNNHGVSETKLVGGIYGVSIGAAFFGESMFHLPQPRTHDNRRDPFDGTSAGQVCLVTLVRHLRRCGYQLFDAQMTTAVTRRFGAYEIPLTDYLSLLTPAVNQPDRWRQPFN